ncbi:2Fe-2S iron-sulfur cluster binding domain-containing protein [Rhizobium sp. S-51]|uniref:2Fe-2S iron-sulfur cluster binding domain-containing protein n=1 Tax=Rhizobium terricola TaxID=2728849 RepID=A0A7Y0AY78_9HYPH|nr:2Fe-2S iron-sulfur cluster-binding protein [Rhizobium terricola]NML75678.1 2Fe-2S iron-sulfur cluster binding domain-containing protein [Rhizobium terricola]
MIRVIFIPAEDQPIEVKASPGDSLMAAAVNGGIAEIIAECGGACACGTCHCYIDESWIAKLPAPGAHEQDMIECVIDPRTESRLSCQVTLTEHHDGLIIHLPRAQH